MWYRKEIMKMLEEIKNYDLLKLVYQFVKAAFEKDRAE